MFRRRNDESERIAVLESQMERIGAQIEAAEKALKRVLDDVEELDDKYTRLRGLVYARKLHKNPVEEPNGEDHGEQVDTSKMTRMELKRYLARSGRFLPGKPTNHQE